MTPIIGNIIAIILLAIVLYVCGKNCIEMVRGELSGKGCAGCSGGCNGSCSGCSSCSSKTTGKK